jgi:hypothetical protein
MADQTYNVNWSAKVSQLGMPALWRLAIWGGLATFALLAAAISGYSNAGSHRQAASSASGQVASGQTNPSPASAPPRIPGETAEETRRLAETVRGLATDRDAVLARIAALEHNLDGVTGTVKRDRSGGPQPGPSPPPSPSPAASAAVPGVRPEPPAARTETLVARAETPVVRPEASAGRLEAPVARTEAPAAPVKEAAVTPAPAPAAAAPPSEPDNAAPAAPDSGNRTVASASSPGRVSGPPEPLAVAAGLGIDVGGASNYEGLRTLWKSTKTSEAELPEEAYPVVTVRENGKTHGAELRLVVGPIADVELASRLCGTLSAAHHYCQPVAFEGQRLSMIDIAPATKAATTPPAKPERTSKATSSHHAAEAPQPTPLQRLRVFNWK